MSLIMSDCVLNCLKEVSWGYPGYRVTFLVVEALLERFSHILTYVKLTKWSFKRSPRICSLLLKCLAIEYLDVASCYARPHFLVNSVSSESSRLTYLILSGHSDISDEDLNIILMNLTGRLKLLDISSCLQLTDVSLLAVYTYLPHLETLLAKWCYGFTDSGIQPTYATGALHPGLFNMKRLKTVDLSDCRQITGSSFVFNKSSDFVMHGLTSLRIGRVGSLHKDVLILIPYIAPQLRVLDISRSLASDETIDLLTYKLCNTLRELFVTSCENLTDQSLSSILRNIPFLQILDVSFCPFISPEGVSIFKSSMPYLHYVKAIYIGSRLNSTELN
ncbi:F-box/LRR-repeat protein [Schistosoma japonicum]|uniref:F-box/LRR-repeat protein n=1 Tax=Schistosoma japonicum TaxID=6182 RepID=A0A4Z2D5E2_SCHJA|nr:F-box/LRR-repeat protein [Schistosoma japonicum]